MTKHECEEFNNYTYNERGKVSIDKYLDDWSFLVDYDQWWNDGVIIRYCPFCGEKLDDET